VVTAVSTSSIRPASRSWDIIQGVLSQQRHPAIGDIDDDGEVEIVLGARTFAFTPSTRTASPSRVFRSTRAIGSTPARRSAI